MWTLFKTWRPLKIEKDLLSCEIKLYLTLTFSTDMHYAIAGDYQWPCCLFVCLKAFTEPNKLEFSPQANHALHDFDPNILYLQGLSLDKSSLEWLYVASSLLLFVLYSNAKHWFGKYSCLWSKMSFSVFQFFSAMLLNFKPFLKYFFLCSF